MISLSSLSLGALLSLINCKQIYFYPAFIVSVESPKNPFTVFSLKQKRDYPTLVNMYVINDLLNKMSTIITNMNMYTYTG